MTSRPRARQTTEREAVGLALEYLDFRAKLRALEPESRSWLRWCGSLALGEGDRKAIWAHIRVLKLEASA